MRRGAAPALEDSAVGIVWWPGILSSMKEREYQHVACTTLRRSTSMSSSWRARTSARDVQPPRRWLADKRSQSLSVRPHVGP